MKPIDRFKNVVNKVVTSKKPDRRLHDVIREVIAANKLEAGQSTVNTEDTRPIPIDQKTTFNGVEISQLSKRQRKKYEKCLKWQEVKKGKRAKEREKMREKRRLARMSNLCLGPSRKELKRSKMKDSSCQVGVAIDLSFDHLMIDKAAKNNETIEEKRSNPSSEDRPVASSDVGDKSDDGLNNRRFQSDSHVFDIDLKSVYPDGNAFAFLSDDSDEEKAEKQKLPYSAGIQLEAEVSLLVSEEDKPQVILENHPVPLIERKAETQRSDDKSRSREHFDSIRTLPQSDSSCFEDLSLWELPRDRMHPIVHPSKRFLRVQSGAKALRELRRSYLVDWHENQLPSNWRTKPVIVDLPHRMRKCKNANKDVMADKLIEIMDANVDKVMEIDQKTTEFVLNGERSDEKCWCEEAQERERPWWRNRTLIMLWIIIGLFLAVSTLLILNFTLNTSDSAVLKIDKRS